MIYEFKGRNGLIYIELQGKTVPNRKMRSFKILKANSKALTNEI